MTDKPFRLFTTLESGKKLFHNGRVLDLTAFNNVPLLGGFSIAEVRLTSQCLFDPLGRPAAAQTLIRGNQFHIVLRERMAQEELSISLYHEVLEAATVAAENPPESVMEFNEGDFEESARSAHAEYGMASPTSLNEMLEKFGFED
ncbi:MAG: hypothetical protein ACREIC_27510 [Limisphaerales bacterium]